MRTVGNKHPHEFILNVFDILGDLVLHRVYHEVVNCKRDCFWLLLALVSVKAKYVRDETYKDMIVMLHAYIC